MVREMGYRARWPKLSAHEMEPCTHNVHLRAQLLLKRLQTEMMPPLVTITVPGLGAGSMVGEASIHGDPDTDAAQLCSGVRLQSSRSYLAHGDLTD